MYKIGQEITTRYTGAPLPLKQRYPIGLVVDILDSETETLLAQFEVSYTDDTKVKGTIISTTPANNGVQPTPAKCAGAADAES